MTNEQLVVAIKAGSNVVENMLQLYLQVKNFIHSVAWRYRGLADLDDLEQEGYLALYDAIDGFDPAADCLFLTYAKHWIRQRMIRYIQNNGSVRIPVHEQELLWKAKKAELIFRQTHGRRPTFQEISRGAGISIDRIVRLQEVAELEKIVSLDVRVNDEDETTQMELIPGMDDIEDSVLSSVEQEQLKAIIWPMVDELPEKQAAVIRMRYQDCITLKAAGQRIGVSAPAAQTLEGRGLLALYHKRRRLKEFFPEKIESIAYRGTYSSFNRTWTSSTERAALKLAEYEEEFAKRQQVGENLCDIAQT